MTTTNSSNSSDAINNDALPFTRPVGLERIDKGDLLLRLASTSHYSKPGGFVGRFIAYAIYSKSIYVGVIVGGSATMHLPGRNEFFGIDSTGLNRVINNTLFHIERPWNAPPFTYTASAVIENRRKYPTRNIARAILRVWREYVAHDWHKTYDDTVIGFETLVLPPRTGEIYRRDGWTFIGNTKGYLCRRISGKTQTERFAGRRVWIRDPSQRKLVFCRRA